MIKIRELSEHGASELLVGYIRRIATLDKIARLYSQLLDDDCIVVYSDTLESSIFKHGEKVDVSKEQAVANGS